MGLVRSRPIAAMVGGDGPPSPEYLLSDILYFSPRSHDPRVSGEKLTRDDRHLANESGSLDHDDQPLGEGSPTKRK